MSDSKEIKVLRETDERDVAISLEHVSMVFNMASERIQNLKEYFIKIAKRELMFKEFVAVNDVSFDVKKGDVFGLVGSNGSGKSTLLKIIAGVLEPSSGTCDVRGSIAPLIELGAGFDMELSARENIYLNGALLGYSKQFIEEHFDSIVGFAEIEDFLEMPMKNYSSGMVARIAFAIATEVVPDILIVDEVLSVGDYMFQEKCEKRISSLINNHDVTVLIVSHDNYLVERLCNKAAWIEKGNLKLIGDAETVCSAYRLLGWHFGSDEAESELIELLCEPSKDSYEITETISGSSPSATSISLWEESPKDYLATEAILAPYSDPALCMIANTVSSRVDAPLLLIEPDRLSGAMRSVLKRMPLEKVVVLGDVSHAVVDAIRELFDDIVVERIGGVSIQEASVNAAHAGECNANRAVIAYPECMGDFLLMIPYLYKHGTPVFIIEPNTVPEASVLESLSAGGFEEIIVLGGDDVFPKDVMAPINELGIPVTVICGNGAMDATRIIHDWIKSADDDLFENVKAACYVPLWNMGDAYSIGRFAAENQALVLLQDSKDVDNVVGNIEILKSLRTKPRRIAFMGSEKDFGDVDKKVVAKAI